MKKIIVFTLLAVLGIGSFSMIPSLARADTQIDKTWAQMRGIINQWGSNNNSVFGRIMANAFLGNNNGTIHEWARSFAIWTDQPKIQLDDPDENASLPPPGNLTIVFYAAKLTNASDVRFDLPGYDLFIAGNWTVAKITTTITVGASEGNVNVTRTFEPIVTEAYGELKVANATFPNKPLELTIDGINTLKGFVIGEIIRHVQIQFLDTNGDGKVDIKDLVRTARRYKTIPGMRGYSFDLDLNGDSAIDVGTLTTVAANIEG